MLVIPGNRGGVDAIPVQRAQPCRSGTTILQRKGVECVSRPERCPGATRFSSAKDFDGNLIELMDLRAHVLRARLVGPLGGRIFR